MITSTPAFALSERNIGIAAALVSAAALGTAFALEALLGLRPCPLCLDQRWAYAFVFVCGVAAATTRGNNNTVTLLAGLAALGFLVGGGFAVYHVGVEHHWWVSAVCEGELPKFDLGKLTQNLHDLKAPACDEVQWRLLGLFSLAELNAVASTAFGLVTAWALLKARLRDA